MKKCIGFIVGMLIFMIHGYSQNIIPERIAILDFQILANEQNLDEYNWISLGFSETLSDAFSRVPQFSVIERTQLDKVIKEQNFQRGNQIDTNSVVGIGRILGVKKVLIGSCQIATGHLLVNMRIVNVETGQVYPIEELPIIAPIDSVLYVQKKICFQILYQFRISDRKEKEKQIEIVTSNSTRSVKAYEFLNRGLAFYNNRQYEEALQMYNVALKHDKKYGKAYYRRGLTNYALSYFEAAANDFNNSENYLKKDTIYLLMSDAYYKQGNYKKSYEYLKKAEKINPKSSTILSAILKLQNGVDYTVKSISDTTKFQTIFEFNNGRAKVKLNSKYGFIDTSNNVVIPIIFDEISDFSYGLAAARTERRWGYINEKGVFVVQPKYTEASKFNKLALARVSIKTKWGIINSRGDVIVPVEFDNYYLSGWEYYNDSLIVVSKSKGLFGFDNVFGVYDITGRRIIPLIYSDIDINQGNYNYNTLSRAYCPYILAALNGKWGVINRNNEIIVPFKYDSKESIGKFTNGYAAVKVNERWGYVDLKGLEVIEPQYDNVGEYVLGFFEVKLRGKWGLVNSKNEQVVSLIYDKIEHIKDRYWAAKKGLHWGIIDISNSVVCSFIYDAMGSEIGGYSTLFLSNVDKSSLPIIVKKNGKQFWINEKCQCIHDCE